MRLSAESGQAHPALIREQDFITVQAITATPRPDISETRSYLLTGPPEQHAELVRRDGAPSVARIGLHWTVPADWSDVG